MDKLGVTALLLDPENLCTAYSGLVPALFHKSLGGQQTQQLDLVLANTAIRFAQFVYFTTGV